MMNSTISLWIFLISVYSLTQDRRPIFPPQKSPNLAIFEELPPNNCSIKERNRHS